MHKGLRFMPGAFVLFPRLSLNHEEITESQPQSAKREDRQTLVLTKPP